VSRDLHARPTSVDETGTSTGGVPLFLVYALWVLTVFEFEWFVSMTIGGPFYRIPTLIAPVLAIAVLMRHVRPALYWPLMLFVFLHVGASVLAENAGYSRIALRFLLFMVLLLAGSVTFLDTPAKAIKVLKFYLLGFAWYGVQGIPSGLVFWHPLMANEDSYGPLMVIGMAFSYFFGLAVSSRRWKWIARGIFLLGVLGVMASFARGAALAAGAVLLYILVRSPGRLRAIGGVALAAIVLVPIALATLPVSDFIAEIQTVSEGDEVRTVLWGVAWNVFKQSPIVGVGAGNFGVVGSMITPLEDVRTIVGDPSQLYHWAVHNAHMQILAEEGLVGILLWLGMIVGFFRRIRRLRREDAAQRWRAAGGTGVDLRTVALGLEGAMVGYLCSSPFYNQLYIHWFWSLLALAVTLTVVTAEPAVDSTGGSELKVAR
jgi:O-antigen ligase